MQHSKRLLAVATVAASLTGALVTSMSSAQTDSGEATVKEIQKYRQALGDDNPAELWEARGEELWKKKRGPKNVSFEQCDIGLGPGKVKGAYAVLPKYFADTDKVEDLESRLVTCMVMLQGISYDTARKHPFGSPEQKSDMEALVAYVTTESRGMTMNIVGNHPKEKEAYDIGKAMFFHRGGPHDFGCVTCHGADISVSACRICQI